MNPSSENKYVMKTDLETVKQELMDTLATKEALEKVDKKTDRIIGAIVQMQERMDGFETKADAEKRLTTIITAIDGLAARIDDMNTEFAAVNHSLMRHDGQFADHENRIQQLEAEKI